MSLQHLDRTVRRKIFWSRARGIALSVVISALLAAVATVVSLLVVVLMVGCEPPEPAVAQPPCWWTFSEENFQSGPPDDRTCPDGGTHDAH